MKKFLTVIAALALCFTAQARGLKFYIGDQEITPGTTVYFNDIEVVDEGSFVTVKMAPELFVVSDIYTSKLMVRATCTSGQEVQLCAGGNCVAGTTITKTNIKVQANQKLPLVFDYVAEYDNADQIPVVTTEIEAQDGDYEETHISYTIMMGTKGSVTVVENPAGLRFAAGALVYDLAGSQSLSVADTEGRTVFTARLSGSGSMPCNLPSGFYVYTLGNKSGKIYIK